MGVDYFQRARRQGASPYVARRYEIYGNCCEDVGLRPAPCSKFLSGVDSAVPLDEFLVDRHGTYAVRLHTAMRRMAAPGTL